MYKNIILLQLATGMRIGEVLARKLTDIDFKNKTFKIDDTLTQDENYGVDTIVIQKIVGHVENSRITNGTYVTLTQDYIISQMNKNIV